MLSIVLNNQKLQTATKLKKWINYNVKALYLFFFSSWNNSMVLSFNMLHKPNICWKKTIVTGHQIKQHLYGSWPYKSRPYELILVKKNWDKCENKGTEPLLSKCLKIIIKKLDRFLHFVTIIHYAKRVMLPKHQGWKCHYVCNIAILLISLLPHTQINNVTEI